MASRTGVRFPPPPFFPLGARAQGLLPLSLAMARFTRPVGSNWRIPPPSFTYSNSAFANIRMTAKGFAPGPLRNSWCRTRFELADTTSPLRGYAWQATRASCDLSSRRSVFPKTRAPHDPAVPQRGRCGIFYPPHMASISTVLIWC